MQELLLRMKKNYTYDAATGRLTSSRLGRAVRGKKRNKDGNKFQTSIYGKSFYFHDPYEAFYHLTLLGRRYKSEKV